MVKLIMGPKGSGKTKLMIELVKEAIAAERGDVVCLEKGAKLMYDIPHKARLISISQYDFGSYAFLKGFLSGLNASNYDVSAVFIEALHKFVDTTQEAELEALLAWMMEFSEKTGIAFTITYAADPALASEGIKKFL
ncbi:MAG: hypothetical protein FWE12_07815 [Oscillospiraceae bacterium]|nr:hypothetical protein [Oscillospiraceae bacterium]